MKLKSKIAQYFECKDSTLEYVKDAIAGITYIDRLV